MSGVQKSQLATFGTRGVRSVNVTVPLLGQNLVLAAPAAGYVRRVQGISVFNLENVSHDVQPQAVVTGTPTLIVSGTANAGGLIQITTTTAHGMATGTAVAISGVTGTTEANDNWGITSTGTNTFTLGASVFANAWISGGVVVKWGVAYGALTPVAPGGVATWGPVLLNAGQALYMYADAAWVSTGEPAVCGLSYEDFPVSSGIGGGLVEIAVVTPGSPLVAAPPAGFRRAIGFNLQGVPTEPSDTMPRFIDRSNPDPAGRPYNWTIQLTVAGQVVSYVALSMGSEQTAYDLRVVLNPGETLTAKLIYTPPQYATAPPASATAAPAIPIAAVLYWQDIAL